MLTLKELKEMEPDTIFAQGEIKDSPAGINMAGTGKVMKWVAVRGGIEDWAIYCDNPFQPQLSYEGVRDYGDKLKMEEHIKKLVPCDDEAFKMYRY
ncbi:MAG: hypothetical protein A2Y57_04190 [Candidatus Woykebacteria bacterium RBG_13_40_7b]|uniref:Uncharacterized protein n=1 Tax=Candidatus Woykebacteria bacterium RBG_13_40_7b TaxID=1802594 RepID=A0A1G1W9B7_9BACT|nr:MAG: hypothetical protein A2Y57_04190 [Candidatus Woykebacteria bacterium RBG_13_40_7b]